MDLLAETNKSPTGRWVLVPRKEERFLGFRDRKRVRVRRRRRAVFTFLLEATAVTLLIGLFPPLRAMLVGTVILGLMLAAYVGLLIRISGQERQRERIDRIRRSRQPEDLRRFPVESLRGATVTNGNVHATNGNGHAGASNGIGNGHAPAANGNGNGYSHALEALAEDDDPLLGTGVAIVEGDVHVIIRRSSDLDAESVRSAR